MAATSSDANVRTVVAQWTKTLRSGKVDVLVSALDEIVTHVQNSPHYFHALSLQITNGLVTLTSRVHLVLDDPAQHEGRTTVLEPFYRCMATVGVAFGFRCAAVLLDAVVHNAGLSWWARPKSSEAVRHLYVAAMPWLASEDNAANIQSRIVSVANEALDVIGEAMLLDRLQWYTVIALYSRPCASDLTLTILAHVVSLQKQAPGQSVEVRTSLATTLATLSSTLHPRRLPLHTRMVVSHISSSASLHGVSNAMEHIKRSREEEEPHAAVTNPATTPYSRPSFLEHVHSLKEHVVPTDSNANKSMPSPGNLDDAQIPRVADLPVHPYLENAKPVSSSVPVAIPAGTVEDEGEQSDSAPSIDIT